MYTIKNRRSINSHGIICEEIKGSREPKCDERLVQILGAMLQIPNIGKCVLSKTNKKVKDKNVSKIQCRYGTKTLQMDKIAKRKRDVKMIGLTDPVVKED